MATLGLRDWWAAQHDSLEASGAYEERRKNVAQFSKYDLLVPWWARYNPELFVRKAYRTNPLVRECIEFRCRAVSMATMYAYREVEEGKEKLSKGHWMQKLLRRPSDLYPTQTRWMRQIERQLQITGECFVFLGRSSSSRSQASRMVGQTQILPGEQIQVFPGQTGIKKYEYRPSGHNEPIPIQPEEMIFFRYDDPVDPIRGVSPLAAAWREIQTDNSMTDYRKGFFDHAAVPSLILTTKNPANSEQLRTWAEDFTDKYGGSEGAGKVAALAGGLEAQRIGATPREVEFGEIGSIPESRIAMAFGIAPSLIGAKVGLAFSSYSNLKEMEAVFWEQTVVPELELIADELTVGLTGLEDDNFCAFDTSRMPGLQAQREKEVAIIKEGLINGAIMVNEYRFHTGHNPVDDGNVYYRPGSLTPVPEGKLDEEPPNPLELMEKQGELQSQLAGEQQATLAQKNGKDPTAPKGGRPAAAEKDQHKAPQPGSANDREDMGGNLTGKASAKAGWRGRKARHSKEPDPTLMKIMDEAHAEGSTRALMEGTMWDRDLYVAKVAGSVRGRLSRINKTHNGKRASQDPGELADWLDSTSLELGNRAADLAYKGADYDSLTALCAEFSHKARIYIMEVQPK